jgi:hypothetical protein
MTSFAGYGIEAGAHGAGPGGAQPWVEDAQEAEEVKGTTRAVSS